MRFRDTQQAQLLPRSRGQVAYLVAVGLAGVGVGVLVYRVVSR